MNDIPDHVSLVCAPFGGWRIWDSTSSREKPDATYVLQARAEKADAEAAALQAENERLRGALDAWQDMMNDDSYDIGEMVHEFDKIVDAALTATDATTTIPGNDASRTP